MFFLPLLKGLSWSWSYGSWIYNYLCHQCLSPLTLWVRISIRVRCTTLCDKVCQWLATGRWLSPGSPVSSTNKILLKVVLNTIKQTFIKEGNPFQSSKFGTISTPSAPLTNFITRIPAVKYTINNRKNLEKNIWWVETKYTRGSAGWACVAHLSFYFEET